MGSAFHQLYPRYSATITTTAPMVNRLWETFTVLTVWKIGKKSQENSGKSQGILKWRMSINPA